MLTDRARNIRRGLLLDLALVAWVFVLFQPVLRLTTVGIYAVNSTAAQWVVVAAGCVALTWPAALVFWTLPADLRLARASRRTLYAIADSIRADPVAARAFNEELRSGRVPRLAVLASGRNALSQALHDGLEINAQ